MSEEIEIVETTKEFDEVLEKNKYVVAYFYAEWSEESLKILPTLLEMNKIFTEIKIIRIPTGDSDGIAEREEIDFFQTWIFYKEGKEQSRTNNEQEIRLNIYKLTGNEKARTPGIVSTFEEYDNIIKSKKLVVVCFPSEKWDGKKFEDYVLGLRKEEKYKDIEILSLDKEETKELKIISEKADIKNTPETLFFKDGKEVSRLEGENKKELELNLEKLADLPITVQLPELFTYESYEKILKSNKYVVTLFLSEWSEKSNKFDGLFEKFSKDPEYSQVKFIKGDTKDEKLRLASDIYLYDFPLILFYEENKENEDYYRKPTFIAKDCDENIFRKRLCQIMGKPIPKVEGEINDLKELEEYLANNKLVAVNFYKPYNKESEKFLATFKEISKNEDLKEIKFVVVNYDAENDQEISKKYCDRSFKAYITFKNGQVYEKYMDYQVEESKIIRKFYNLAGKFAPKEEGEVREINEFEKIIKENKKLVCAFINDNKADDLRNFVADCVLKRIDEIYKTTKTIKVYIELCPEICEKYNDKKEPLLIFFNDGKEAKRFTELEDFDPIISKLEDFLPPKGDIYNSKYHEHPLIQKSTEEFVCSNCGIKYTNNYIRVKVFYCKECDFSFCGRCKLHEKRNEEIIKHDIVTSKYHKEHTLYYRRKKCICNKCRNPKKEAYHCKKCDYDLCQECWEIEKKENGEKK